MTFVCKGSVRAPVTRAVPWVDCILMAQLVFQVSPQSPRYIVVQHPSVSVLRIETARLGRDDAKYECVAENGVGDAVTASGTLSIYKGRRWLSTTSVSSPIRQRLGGLASEMHPVRRRHRTDATSQRYRFGARQFCRRRKSKTERTARATPSGLANQEKKEHEPASGFHFIRRDMVALSIRVLLLGVGPSPVLCYLPCPVWRRV